MEEYVYTCQCKKGYSGDDCSISILNNIFRKLSS